MRVGVVGNGMVGHRLLEHLAGRGHAVTTFCEEPRLAYDRVHLTGFFEGRELALADRYEGVEVHIGERAVKIDRERRGVVSSKGRVVEWDRLVLATGSSPFVPPIPGRDAKGCFVYRTIEDVEAIRAWAASAKRGVVIGGGLLGLEAANALRQLGLEVHIVEVAPRLMSVQLDETGGAVLRQ